jgi:SAM-dependent methyltransferase
MSAYPLPPRSLVQRVGWDLHAPDPLTVYEQRGREQWRLVKEQLPADWTPAGRRMLDFGAGAGRLVRHALADDPGVECWACDLDAASVAWMRSHLSPPLHVFQSGEWPPTAQATASFDLICAFSVFTHLRESWSAWLLELRRLLREDGLLIATVFGPGIDAHGDVPVGEDVNGMNVVAPGTSWNDGGPLIIHSEWWLRAHWGRAFEIVRVRRGEPGGPPPLYGQSLIAMRPRATPLTPTDLERAETGEPRELAAAQSNVTSLCAEIERLNGELATFASSRSWRITGPLRATGRLVRGAGQRTPSR